MDLSPSNYISINEILSDVLKVVKDSSFKLNTRGWYTSQIQQALEELSFDTFFDERSESFTIPENLRLDMPKGAFNLRQMYLFNGTNCVIGKSANVYHKKNFINGSSGSGYVARDKWNNGKDPFYKGRGVRDRKDIFEPDNTFFYSMQNGMIMLSENCRKYENIKIVYNGISSDIGEEPLVPQFFRQAVKDWVLCIALEMKASDTVGTNEYTHWMGLTNRYQASKDHPYDGSWAKAERRAKTLNEKERQDIKEYMSQLNY